MLNANQLQITLISDSEHQINMTWLHGETVYSVLVTVSRNAGVDLFSQNGGLYTKSTVPKGSPATLCSETHVTKTGIIQLQATFNLPTCLSACDHHIMLPR